MSKRNELIEAEHIRYRLRVLKRIDAPYKIRESYKEIDYNELKLKGTIVDFDLSDIELARLYANIQLKAYEDALINNHGGPFENLIGVIGELCFKEALIREGIKKFEYLERDFTHPSMKIKGDERPYDFIVAGKKLEICTIDHRKNAKNCIVKDTKINQFNYVVAVKILNIDCKVKVYNDEKKDYVWIWINNELENGFKEIEPPNDIESSEAPVGNAIICGYDEHDNVLKKWRKANNEYPCFLNPCYYKRIDKMSNIVGLWRYLKTLIK